MKEIGKIIKLMEMKYLNFQKGIYIKENLKKVKKWKRNNEIYQ